MIEYAALSKMQVKDPRAYLREAYPGGVALSSVYMKQELLAAAESELDEACANKSALDVRTPRHAHAPRHATRHATRPRHAPAANAWVGRVAPWAL